MTNAKLKDNIEMNCKMLKTVQDLKTNKDYKVENKIIFKDVFEEVLA